MTGCIPIENGDLSLLTPSFQIRDDEEHIPTLMNCVSYVYPRFHHGILPLARPLASEENPEELILERTKRMLGQIPTKDSGEKRSQHTISVLKDEQERKHHQ